MRLVIVVVALLMALCASAYAAFHKEYAWTARAFLGGPMVEVQLAAYKNDTPNLLPRDLEGTEFHQMLIKEYALGADKAEKLVSRAVTRILQCPSRLWLNNLKSGLTSDDRIITAAELTSKLKSFLLSVGKAGPDMALFIGSFIEHNKLDQITGLAEVPQQLLQQALKDGRADVVLALMTKAGLLAASADLVLEPHSIREEETLLSSLLEQFTVRDRAYYIELASLLKARPASLGRDLALASLKSDPPPLASLLSSYTADLSVMDAGRLGRICHAMLVVWPDFRRQLAAAPGPLPQQMLKLLDAENTRCVSRIRQANHPSQIASSQKPFESCLGRVLPDLAARDMTEAGELLLHAARLAVDAHVAGTWKLEIQESYSHYPAALLNRLRRAEEQKLPSASDNATRDLLWVLEQRLALHSTEQGFAPNWLASYAGNSTPSIHLDAANPGEVERELKRISQAFEGAGNPALIAEFYRYFSSMRMRHASQLLASCRQIASQDANLQRVVSQAIAALALRQVPGTTPEDWEKLLEAQLMDKTIAPAIRAELAAFWIQYSPKKPSPASIRLCTDCVIEMLQAHASHYSSSVAVVMAAYNGLNEDEPWHQMAARLRTAWLNCPPPVKPPGRMAAHTYADHDAMGLALDLFARTASREEFAEFFARDSAEFMKFAVTPLLLSRHHRKEAIADLIKQPASDFPGLLQTHATLTYQEDKDDDAVHEMESLQMEAFARVKMQVQTLLLPNKDGRIPASRQKKATDLFISWVNQNQPDDTSQLPLLDMLTKHPAAAAFLAPRFYKADQTTRNLKLGYGSGQQRNTLAVTISLRMVTGAFINGSDTLLLELLKEIKALGMLTPLQTGWLRALGSIIDEQFHIHESTAENNHAYVRASLLILAARDGLMMPMIPDNARINFRLFVIAAASNHLPEIEAWQKTSHPQTRMIMSSLMSIQGSTWVKDALQICGSFPDKEKRFVDILLALSKCPVTAQMAAEGHLPSDLIISRPLLHQALLASRDQMPAFTKDCLLLKLLDDACHSDTERELLINKLRHDIGLLNPDKDASAIKSLSRYLNP